MSAGLPRTLVDASAAVRTMVELMSLPDPAPFSTPPAQGAAIEVAPGVLWLRLALPFRLNHVNIYLVEDDTGWLLIDTGAGDAATLALWTALLDDEAGVLRGRPVARILVTHHHPDHVGAAAFLANRTEAALLMGEVEYLTGLNLVRGDIPEETTVRSRFYLRHGLDAGQLAETSGHLDRYRSIVPDLPSTFRPLRHDDIISAGRRRLAVIEAPGHAPAQMLLHSGEDNLLFAADHVMPRISPNVGVMDRNPDDDPLGRYLVSLASLRARVPDGGLVLPGHHLPFRRLHERTRELEVHHGERCALIETACSEKGLTVAELVPILFPFPLDAHQWWFAFSEVLAHCNHLGTSGRLAPRDSHGRRRWGHAGRLSHRVSG